MNESISILIIEDEKPWAQALHRGLEDFGFNIAGIATNFEEAIAALNHRNFDIVLVDIHLNGRESGIELGRMIPALFRKPFIFITASLDPGVVKAAIEARPSAYLTKPVHPASLFATIHSALHNFASSRTPTPDEAARTESFFVKQGDKYKKLNWNEVVCLRSEKNYTGLLNAADGATYFIRSTLPRTLKSIVPENLRSAFAQINRSEVLQIRYVDEIIRDDAYTAFGKFEISASHMKDLKEKLGLIS